MWLVCYGKQVHKELHSQQQMLYVDCSINHRYATQHAHPPPIPSSPTPLIIHNLLPFIPTRKTTTKSIPLSMHSRLPPSSPSPSPQRTYPSAPPSSHTHTHAPTHPIHQPKTPTHTGGSAPASTQGRPPPSCHWPWRGSAACSPTSTPRSSGVSACESVVSRAR